MGKLLIIESRFFSGKFTRRQLVCKVIDSFNFDQSDIEVFYNLVWLELQIFIRTSLVLVLTLFKIMFWISDLVV